MKYKYILYTSYKGRIYSDPHDNLKQAYNAYEKYHSDQGFEFIKIEKILIDDAGTYYFPGDKLYPTDL